MKAYLINSETKTITPVDYNGDYNTIYTHIGCDLFDVVYANINEHRISVFVDDEGLLKNPQHFFILKGYGQPLAGNGLVLGDVDEEGETLAAPDDLDLSSVVTFLNLPQAQEAIEEEAERDRQDDIKIAMLEARIAKNNSDIEGYTREIDRLGAAIAASEKK